MARFQPTFEQGTSVDAGTTSSTPLAYTTNVKIRSLLTCEIGYDSASSSVSTVTDTQGNTWSLAKRQGGNGTSAEVWYAEAGTAGANTVTVTYTGSIANRVAIQEWSRARDAVVHTTNGNSDSGTAHSHGSITITTFPVLIVSAFQCLSASTYSGSPPPGFTLRVDNQSSLYVHTRVTTGQPVITTCPWTTTLSEQGSGVNVAFQKGPLPPPGTHEENLTVSEFVAAELIGYDAYWLDGFEVVSSPGQTAISVFWYDGLPYNFGPTVGPPGVHFDNIAVTDAVVGALIVNNTTLNVNRSDAITVADVVTARLTGLITASKTEAIAVAEFVKAALSLYAKVDDDITVADVVDAELRPTLRVLGLDTITVTDFAKVVLSLGVRLSETVTVTDVVTVFLPTAKMGIDAITVTDVVKAVVTPSVIRINDRITVTDARTARISGPLTVHVWDTVNVVESGFNPKVVLTTVIIDDELAPTPFTAGDYWVVGVQ